MQDIELERYQHKFNYPMKHSSKPEEVKVDPISLVKGVPPLLEAHVSAAAQDTSGASPTDARLNKVYGARASYINNTLMHDTEYLHYFGIWLIVFAMVIYSLHRVMRSTLSSKQSKQACE